jgi:hypothetical protein
MRLLRVDLVALMLHRVMDLQLARLLVLVRLVLDMVAVALLWL